MNALVVLVSVSIFTHWLNLRSSFLMHFCILLYFLSAFEYNCLRFDEALRNQGHKVIATTLELKVCLNAVATLFLDYITVT